MVLIAEKDPAVHTGHPNPFCYTCVCVRCVMKKRTAFLQGMSDAINRTPDDKGTTTPEEKKRAKLNRIIQKIQGENVNSPGMRQD